MREKIGDLLRKGSGLLYLGGRALLAKNSAVKNDKVLIVAGGHIGDILMCASAIVALKEKYRAEGKEIYLLCPPVVGEVLKLVPGLDGVLFMPNLTYTLKYSYSWLSKLQKQVNAVGYETIVGFMFSPALFYFCAGLTGRKRFLLAPVVRRSYPRTNKFFSRACAQISIVKDESVFHGTKHFLKGLGLPDFSPKIVSLQTKGQRNFLQGREYFSVLIDASNPVRTWPDEHWLALIELLLQNYSSDLCVLGVGASNAFQKKLEGIAARYQGRVHNLVGKTTLYEWIELIQGSTFVIGVDSGGCHAAAAVGTQSFCLAGLWGLKAFFPYPADVVTATTKAPICIRREDAKSVPCKNCAETTGVIGKTNKQCYEFCKKNEPCLCMQKLSPRQVLGEIEKTFPPAGGRNDAKEVQL